MNPEIKMILDHLKMKLTQNYRNTENSDEDLLMSIERCEIEKIPKLPKDLNEWVDVSIQGFQKPELNRLYTEFIQNQREGSFFNKEFKNPIYFEKKCLFARESKNFDLYSNKTCVHLNSNESRFQTGPILTRENST